MKLSILVVFGVMLALVFGAEARKASKKAPIAKGMMNEVFEIQHDKSVTLKDGLEVKFFKWDQETTAPAPGTDDSPQMFFSVVFAMNPNEINPDMLKIEEFDKPVKWKSYTFTVLNVQLDREPRTVKVRVQK